MSSSLATKPERGGCLTWWIGVFVFIAIIAILILLFSLVSGAQLIDRKDGLLIIPLTRALIDLVCIYGIYNWKRWGLYGFIIANIIGFVVGLFAYTPTLLAIISNFIEIGILLYLVRNKWRHFN